MSGSSELFSEEYVYEPLAHSDSIRLLKLMPSTHEGELLKCDFMQFNLSECPSYEVISQTWGPGLPTVQNILVEGRLFPVRPNLDSALRSFVEEDRPRCLWVDAICINQADNKERNAQVALTTEIISRSRCLLIWLGMSTPDTKRSFMCLENLAACAESYGVRTWSDSNEPIMLSERQMFDQLPSVVNSWELERVYESSWFNRLWNLLEVISASKIVICCGRNLIDFHGFVKATAIIKKFIHSQGHVGSPLKDLKIGPASSILTTWQMSSYEKDIASYDEASTKLWYMKRVLYYLYYNRQDCSVESDRIYAIHCVILGAKRSRALGFSIEYSRETTPQTYSNFARTYLMQGVLDILGFAGILYTLYKTGPDQEEHWPSWVPDWRFPELLTEPFSCGTSWHAATNLPPKVVFNDPESQGSSISVSGIFLDSIELGVIIIEPSSHTTDDALSQMAKYSTKARVLYDTQRSKNRYATGENSLTAFVRTITLDSEVFLADAVTSEVDVGSVAVDMWLKYEDECVKWNSQNNLDPSHQRELRSQDSWRFSPYAEVLAARVKNRQFFITSGNYIGMAPWFALGGDRIAIFAGAETPFILRPSGNGEMYHIVSDCYLHGFMYGELLDDVLLSKMRRIMII